MSKRVVSRLELVRRSKRAKSALYRDCEEGGQLHPAVVGAGRNLRVDLDHQAARHWCITYGYQEPDIAAVRKQVKSETKTQPVASAPKAEAWDLVDPDGIDEDDEHLPAKDILNMPLREVVHRYGKNAQFKDYVIAAKNLVTMQGLEEEQARKRGEYIHRSNAERLVELIDSMAKALLTDAAVSVATSLSALIKSGASQRELEDSVRRVNERLIKQAKEQFKRSMRNA